MDKDDIRISDYVMGIKHLFYKGYSREKIIQELPDKFQDFAPHDAMVNYWFKELLRDRTTVYFERLPTDPIDKVDCTGEEDFVLHENFYITKLADVWKKKGPDTKEKNEKELAPSSPAVEKAFSRMKINPPTNRPIVWVEPISASDAAVFDLEKTVNNKNRPVRRILYIIKAQKWGRDMPDDRHRSGLRLRSITPEEMAADKKDRMERDEALFSLFRATKLPDFHYKNNN